MEPMIWKETYYTILMIGIVLTLIMSAAYVIWRLRRVPKASVGVLIFLMGAVWALGFVLEMVSTDLPSKLFWVKIKYVGIATVPTALLIFTLQHTRQKKWFTPYNLLLLSIAPTTMLVLTFTNEYHHLIWRSVELDTGSMYSELVRSFGVGYWIYITYTFVLSFFACFLLIRMLIRGRRLYRWQASGPLVAISIALLFGVVDLLHLRPFKNIDIGPLGIAVAGLIMVWGIIRWRLADIVPLARGAVLDSMTDSIIVLDEENCIVDLNPHAQQLIGTTGSKVIGQPVEQVWPAWVNLIKPDVNGAVGKEVELNLGDGRRIYDVRVSPLVDWRGDLVSQVAILRDITERKEAEKLLYESEDKFRTIFENANDLMVYIDKNGKVDNINQKVEELLGYRPEEIIGKNFTSLDFFDIKEMGELADFFRNMILEDELQLVPLTELELRHKNGNKVFIEGSVRVIRKGGKVEGVLAIVRDITERKQAEEKIKASLKEKEVLLREVHHRVKNNMQVICSLLNLQSKYVEDTKVGEMFKESQNRIRSMALIHENLYHSEDVANVDFRKYVENLVYGLFRSFGVTNNHITPRIEVENVPLDINIAIPCGLIINELVANSLKHAFVDGRQGEIVIALHPTDGAIELVVSDNGVGIPEEVDFRNTETLGLYLVTILAEDQLEGEIKLMRGGGTAFHITFSG